MKNIISQLKIHKNSDEKSFKENEKFFHEKEKFSKENQILAVKSFEKPEKTLETKVLSPLHNGRHLKNTEMKTRISQEQENLEKLEQSYKEIESFMSLASLKQKKANIENLRNSDLEKIKQLTSKNGSENEIFKLFQDIINRRYEKINDMFEENIKAVQEALAQSVLSEDSSMIYSIDLNQNIFQKISKENSFSNKILENLEKKSKNLEINDCDKEKNSYFMSLENHSSPELIDPNPLFFQVPKNLSLCDPSEEPEKPSFSEIKSHFFSFETENSYNNKSPSSII